MNYKQKYIIAKNSIKPIITEDKQTKSSGIYLFERIDEDGITFFYCGQAKNIYTRTISHWQGYTQRIDRSLKKRKFYSEENPYGWKFTIVEYCDNSELDEREEFYIMQNLREGKQTYNETYGSQGKGKKAIKEYRQPRGYRQGVEQGKKVLAKEIAHLFDLHLDVSVKKQGNKNQEKALAKFWDLINVENYIETKGE